LRIAAAAFVSLLAFPVNAATVQGQLVFASGAPATYIAVRLNSKTRGPSVFVNSGGDGRFYFKNVPAGDYQIEVWRGPKRVTSVAVTVKEPVTKLNAITVP
jgi:hypothetical protein